MFFQNQYYYKYSTFFSHKENKLTTSWNSGLYLNHFSHLIGGPYELSIIRTSTGQIILGGKRRVGINYQKQKKTKKTLKEILTMAQMGRKCFWKQHHNGCPRRTLSPVQTCIGW